ncbi:MAG: hypothetical protein AABW80_03730 [Nanoarchaeota archaeon]
MAEQKIKNKNVQKQFFEVKVPMTAANVSLYATSADELEGKMIKIDLSKNLRGKNMELKMKVKLENGELIAEPVSASILNVYLRKAVRKGTDYVEDSFKVKCKDNELIVKPLLVTRNKVSRAIRRELRNVARDLIVGFATPKMTKEIFTDIMTNKLQKEIAVKLKKIYPLSLSEIRMLEIVKKKESFEQKSI